MCQLGHSISIPIIGIGVFAFSDKASHSLSCHAKLIFSADKMPEVYEDTDAFFRRWVITAFPIRLEGIKADPNLLSKVTIPEELSGLLNWAIGGLQR